MELYDDDPSHVVSLGFEDSWSLCMAWLERCLKTGEDTDMFDRKGGHRSFIPYDQRPIQHHRKMVAKMITAAQNAVQEPVGTSLVMEPHFIDDDDWEIPDDDA